MTHKHLQAAAVFLSIFAAGFVAQQAQAQSAPASEARNLKLQEDRYTGNFCTEGEAYCLRMTGPNSVSYKSASGISGQLSGLPVRSQIIVK